MSKYGVVQFLHIPSGKYYMMPIYDMVKSNMKAGEILKTFTTFINSPEELNLSIRSLSGFSFVLDDNDDAFALCPMLQILPNKRYETEPAFFFLAANTAKDKAPRSITVSFPVISTDLQPYYNYTLSMKYPLKLKKILSHLAHIHDVPDDQIDSSFKIYSVNGDEYPLNHALFKIVEDFMYNRIYIVYDATEKAKKVMRLRYLSVKEIVDTEGTYVETLRGFEANVGGFFKKTGWVPKELYTMLLQSANYILSLHEEMYNDFLKIDIDFMACVGWVFKKFVPFLKIYLNYMATFDQVIGIIKKYMLDPQYEAIFEEFRMSEYAKQIRFDGILIKPVQRAPKYKLLIRETFKHTSKHHPDYKNLIDAMNMCTVSMKTLDDNVMHLERRQQVFEYSNAFKPKAAIIQPNRELLHLAHPQKKDTYGFFVFSDELWIALYKKGTYNLKRQLNYNEVVMLPYANNSICLRVDGEDNIYAMPDTESRDELVKYFREASILRQSSIGSDVTMTIEAIPQNSCPVPSLHNHCMVYVNDYLYIYGGLMKDNALNEDLYMVNTHDMGVQVFKSSPRWPQARQQPGMVVRGTEIYIYGGTNDGKTPLGDLWKFNTARPSWSQVVCSDDVTPPPAIAPAMYATDEFIIMVCGTELLEVWKFAFADIKWTKLNNSGLPLKPVTGGTLAPVYKNAYILVGGTCSDGKSNDNVILLARGGEYQSLAEVNGLTLIDRNSRASCLIKNVVVVPGTRQDPYMLCLMCDSHSWIVPKLIGNYVAADNAASATDGKVLYLHGGLNDVNEVISVLYRITLKTELNEIGNIIGMQDPFGEDALLKRMVLVPTSIKDAPYVEADAPAKKKQ